LRFSLDHTSPSAGRLGVAANRESGALSCGAVGKPPSRFRIPRRRNHRFARGTRPLRHAGPGHSATRGPTTPLRGHRRFAEGAPGPALVDSKSQRSSTERNHLTLPDGASRAEMLLID